MQKEGARPPLQIQYHHALISKATEFHRKLLCFLVVFNSTKCHVQIFVVRMRLKGSAGPSCLLPKFTNTELFTTVYDSHDEWCPVNHLFSQEICLTSEGALRTHVQSLARANMSKANIV